MKKWTFTKQSLFDVSRDTLFDWHERCGAFERLSPPWQTVRVLSQDLGLKEGAQVTLQLFMYRVLRLKWVLVHGPYQKGHLFVDTQRKGPFAFWQHKHQFLTKDTHSAYLIDQITYQMKWGLGQKKVARDLESLFRYRHEVLKHDLELQHTYPSPSKKIAITGASGFIGQAMTHLLTTAGHEVISLTRRPQAHNEVIFNYETGQFDYQKLEGIDGVIHLAGENIASGRWSTNKKKRIYDSRVLGTKLLVQGLSQLKRAPNVLISVSGMGYYGYHPQDQVDEKTPQGDDFLSQVCQDWESEATKYQRGRVVIPRLGMVLSPKAGALKKLVLPTLLGLSGVFGSGRQWIPWITIDDVLYGVYRLLMDTSICGPINFVAGSPISNKTFIKKLGACLKRPTFFSLPGWLLKLLFGEMAEATLLSSVKVKSSHPIMSESALCYPCLDKALKHLFGKLP